MCGIAGFLTSNISDVADFEGHLRHMADAMVSRGPDSSGVWFDRAGIGLSHRRLSILDLSSAGHQPMISICGRYVFVFNGEIYNHLKLRSELQSDIKSGSIVSNWRGHSDTETLLRGFTVWGIKETITKCIGMFAFAVWDKKERILTLGRDRMGEKPLYYGWQGSNHDRSFLFGSELKSLKVHSSFVTEINRDALCLLMRFGYIPAPHSIYKNIFKLKAGSLLSVSLDKPEPTIEAYWSFADVAIAGVGSTMQDSPNEIVSELDCLLRSAVAQQMQSDVPLGAFLSGGIDSTTVVALMQAQTNRPVKTFTIGFNEVEYNEAKHAKVVSSYLGTEHTELYVTPHDAINVIPKLPIIYCEPFADVSQIPTFLVSQLARQQVTVSLSGDAGDELFAGYNRYLIAQKYWGKISYIPGGLRSLTESAIHNISPTSWNTLFDIFQFITPNSIHQANIGDKLHKAARLLSSDSFDDFYRGLVSHWSTQDLVIGGLEPLTCMHSNGFSFAGLDNIQRMMAMDSITYLPDNILVKLDRAAMGVSLEGRVPFLDHRVVEFAWRIPQTLKIRDGISKWILRQVLYRYVPQELIDRPKMGFGVPIDSWLRGPLRDWAEMLLDEGRLKREGYFHPAIIRTKWIEHLSGKRNWQYLLWNVLMFQSWLMEQHS